MPTQIGSKLKPPHECLSAPTTLPDFGIVRTFLGLLSVTLVILGTFFKPSVSRAFLAFRSERDWILSRAAFEVVTDEEVGENVLIFSWM
jgi:hypothetical protein